MRAQDILPDAVDEQARDGIVVRKGTVGAFLVNAQVWSNRKTSRKARAEAEAHIIEALPALRALGVFDVLAIRDPALRALVSTQTR